MSSHDGHIRVIKIGGNVVDNPEALRAFVADLAGMRGPRILVHGGGKEATRLSGRLGIETTMIEGRRVTDAATIDVVTMVYAGLINKRIVAGLQAAGANAIGLCGADGNVIPAKRRPANPVDYGFVGDIDPSAINDGLIATLLDSGIVPVFCAICHDGNGSLLNCNADSVASAVAVAASRIRPVDLTYCFEMPGVMRDINDPDSLIPHITPGLYADLKSEGVVSKGMIPKIDNAFAAINQGVSSVRICRSDALLTDVGTVITA
ncbi:MAG: acetylglutamate kinase [Muribaculaceae bacterium]|nr:acetylglutamate kinase [Muribaculaceae bacterium]